MQYTDSDLPVVLKHGEMFTAADGTTIRFESNGEAKDVMVGDAYAPETTLFPDCDHVVETSRGSYKCTARFEDAMEISKA